MSIGEDLTAYVKQTFREAWTTRSGQVVPSPENLKHSNDAVEFERATVLYADLRGSTSMVDSKTWQFAAEIYKNFLYCAGRLIRDSGGEITAYDGDRVMGVFVGDSQSNSAARCALKINFATTQLIMPALKAQYPHQNFSLKHVVGIDTSSIRAARTGVRGDNDLVWVGRAANHAAKLTEISLDFATWITADVYGYLNKENLFGGADNAPMWKKHNWTQMGGTEIYGSTWWWRVT